MSRPRLRGRRRLVAVLSCASLAVAAALVQPTLASADPTNPYVITGTEIPDASAADGEMTDIFGSVKELGPKNASSTKIGVIHKANPPMLDKTNPNAQVDLRRAWLDLQRDSEQNDWVYFAWERDSNSGSGFIAFEFMKDGAPVACDYDASEASLISGCNPWKNRQSGDFLILWDQNGGSTDLYKRVWGGTAPNLTLGAPVAIVNGAAKFSPDKFKGEAAVNLTAEGLSDPDNCVAFANVIPSTVTGNSDTADYKDTILDDLPPISNCTAEIVTTPKDGNGDDLEDGAISIGTGVVAVTDSAEISLSGGSATPTGAISFRLCMVGAPSTCTDVGSTNLTSDSYPETVLSPVAYVTSAGRYCWSSSWPGDEDNGIPAASESAETECFDVTAVDPTLTTSAGADVILGNGVSDTASLGGTATRPDNPVINLTGDAGPAADGTITFKLYGPSNTGCGSLVHTTAAVPVAGDDDYTTPAPQFAPTAVGNYHWVATYSGSSPNTNGVSHNTACDETAEDVAVTDVPSSLSTAQRWVPNDRATISANAGGALAGTVTFTLFASANCAVGTDVGSWDVPVSGASPQTVGSGNTAAMTTDGTWSWRVSYDSTNPAQRDIPASCDEVSTLDIENGGTHTSP